MKNFLAKATWYPFLFSKNDTVDLFRTIFFWVTIAVIFLAVLTLFIVKGEKRGKVGKIILACLIFYACVVAVTFLVLQFKDDGIVDILFYPILITILIIAISVLVLSFNKTKIIQIVCLVCFICSLLATLICMAVYFKSGKSEEFNWVKVSKSENFWLYFSAFILIAILFVIAFLSSEKIGFDFNSKSISFGAICIALSFSLSFIRIFKLPQGGSVTVASLLPLILYSYIFGTKKGILVGLIYGILQALQDPYIVHPMQFLLDYPIAFASVGLGGFYAHLKGLKKLPQLKFLLGGILVGTFRFLSHILSGVFAFSEYAGGENALIYSLTYNSFVFVDLAIVLFVGVILFSSKSFMRQIERLCIS